MAVKVTTQKMEDGRIVFSALVPSVKTEGTFVRIAVGVNLPVTRERKALGRATIKKNIADYQAGASI